MRVYMSIAVRNNMHFVLYRYCCEGRYSVNIHLTGKVREFDHDWRVATLLIVMLFLGMPALCRSLLASLMIYCWFLFQC